MEPGPHATLDRRLGPFTATCVVVANVIGAGIFTTSGFIARDLADPVALLAVWVVGGMLALAGALSYSELGAAMPEAGGEYVYLRETYGPLVGFLSGWVSFFIGFSGAIAAVSLAFAHYLAHFFPAVEPPRVAGIVLAIGLVWGLAAVHALGVGPGGLFQRMITAATVSAILVLVVAGFWLGTGDTAHFRSAQPAMWRNFPVSLVFVMFAYSGWNAAAYLAGEIREPARNLPLALLGGTVMVTALYLALNTFYLYALPIPEMAGVQSIAEKASVAAFGQVASHLVTGMLLLALAGSVSAMVLAGPRVYFAMARDGVFPQAIASVHPRFHTPARGHLLAEYLEQHLDLRFGLRIAGGLHKLHPGTVCRPGGSGCLRAARAPPGPASPLPSSRLSFPPGSVRCRLPHYRGLYLPGLSEGVAVGTADRGRRRAVLPAVPPVAKARLILHFHLRAGWAAAAGRSSTNFSTRSSPRTSEYGSRPIEGW